MSTQTKDISSSTASKPVSLVLKKTVTYVDTDGKKHTQQETEFEITPAILDSKRTLCASGAKQLVDYFNNYSCDPKLAMELERLDVVPIQSQHKEDDKDTKTLNAMNFLTQTLDITKFNENTSYADGMLAYLTLAFAYDKVRGDTDALSELKSIFEDSTLTDNPNNDALLAYHRNELVNFYHTLGSDEKERSIMASVMFNGISGSNTKLLEEVHDAAKLCNTKPERHAILLTKSNEQDWDDINRKLCDINNLSVIVKYHLRVRRMNDLLVSELDGKQQMLEFLVEEMNHKLHDQQGLDGDILCESITDALKLNQPNDAMNAINGELSYLLVNLVKEEMPKGNNLTYATLASILNDLLYVINTQPDTIAVKDIPRIISENLGLLPHDAPITERLNNISFISDVINLYFEIHALQEELAALAREVKSLGNELRSTKQALPENKSYAAKISSFLDLLDERNLLQFKVDKIPEIRSLESETASAEEAAGADLHKTARQLILQMNSNELLRASKDSVPAFA